jgi:Tfp pilus assembly protein PilF
MAELQYTRFVVQESSRGPKSVPEKAKETLESKALFNQALEFLSRSQTHQALEKVQKALRIAPRNSRYMSLYGLCVAMERGDHESAEKLCEKAIRLDPRDPVNRVNLGKVYRLEGRTSDAYDQFIGAWEVDRFHPAPAAELSRMGIRRPPVVPFLPRGNWLNVHLGRLRARMQRCLSSIL